LRCGCEVEITNEGYTAKGQTLNQVTRERVVKKWRFILYL